MICNNIIFYSSSKNFKAFKVLKNSMSMKKDKYIENALCIN